MVESDRSINLRLAAATMVATTGVDASHQLVRVVLKTLGCSRRKES